MKVCVRAFDNSVQGHLGLLEYDAGSIDSYRPILILLGRDRVGGRGIRYGLEGPWIDSRWGARFSATVQTGSGAHPAVVGSGRGVALTTHPQLAPRFKKGYSYTSTIPLFPLWAFVACYKVTFYLYLNFLT
jgi:hypothetical protein